MQNTSEKRRLDEESEAEAQEAAEILKMLKQLQTDPNSMAQAMAELRGSLQALQLP